MYVILFLALSVYITIVGFSSYEENIYKNVLISDKNIIIASANNNFKMVDNQKKDIDVVKIFDKIKLKLNQELSKEKKTVAINNTISYAKNLKGVSNCYLSQNGKTIIIEFDNGLKGEIFTDAKK